MLSLSLGTKIAMYEHHKGDNKTEKFIYVKDDERNKAAEIETTKEKKDELFHEYLLRDKKLRFADIAALDHAYKHDASLSPKLERKYDDAKRYVNDSLKYYLDFPKGVELHPIVTQPTYRMFISGLSGSGKSTYITNFLKYNKPKFIFIFSPVLDDQAFKKLKPEPVHLNLATYEKEYEKPFEIEDFPKDSVCIFDDTDTDDNAHLYHKAKIQLLERGRHLQVSTIVVSHRALGGNNKPAVTQLLECEFFVVFGKSNRSHAEKLLKRYVGTSTAQTEVILNMDSRGVLIKKSHPRYAIGEHTIMTLN